MLKFFKRLFGLDYNDNNSAAMKHSGVGYYGINDLPLTDAEVKPAPVVENTPVVEAAPVVNVVEKPVKEKKPRKAPAKKAAPKSKK